MGITTIEQVKVYLKTYGIPFSSVEQLYGGSTNYVWLVINPTTPERSIIKHAEPYLAGNTSCPFPVDRMTYEVCALTHLPAVISGTLEGNRVPKVVQLPTMIHHDTDNHILQLADAGSQTLADLYADPRLDASVIGRELGRWLAELHLSTTGEQIRRTFNHPVAKSMYRWNFNNLLAVLQRYGHDPALGERINARYGALIESDDECVCHSDLWPGNILLTGFEDSKDTNLVQRPHFTLIDWEVARNGSGMTDVGHFAGEAWLLDHLRGQRGMLGAFLDGYVKRKGRLGAEECWRVAAQFATHVTHWPTIYGWISEEETKECVNLGAEFLLKVDQRDTDWITSGPLSAMYYVAGFDAQVSVH